MRYYSWKLLLTRLIMQGAIISTAILLGLAAFASCDPVGPCPPADPEDFHMPDDKDCTVFYKCAHGVPVKFDCPAPLHFNRKISVCDWPQDAGCTAGSGPTTVSTAGTTEPPTCSCTCPAVPDTTPTASSSTEAPSTTAAPSSSEDPSSTAAPSSSEAPSTTAAPSSTDAPSTTAAPAVCDAIGTCPVYTQTSLAVHLPHRSKCDVYCRCDHGKPIEMPCAPGTWFNAALQVCDWPANSGCVPGSGPTTAAPTDAPSSSDAPSTTTAPSSSDAPSTTATPSTTVAAPAVCDAIGTCPEYTQTSLAVHLPHRSKCDVYCRCDHGKPIEMPCAPGTWFNAALQVCDWPANSGCVPGSGPTTAAPTDATPSTTAAPSTTSAPSSTTAAPTTNTTPSRPRCDAVGTCPIYDQDSIVVHLPHRTRCDVYCRCDHGEPIEMPCGPGTWFNKDLEVCDHPQDSGCTPGLAKK